MIELARQPNTSVAAVGAGKRAERKHGAPVLQIDALGRGDALRRRRRRADLKQLGGKPHPADRTGKIELAVRRRLRAGKRAAAIMSLLDTARINGHEPCAYLKDVLERLPTQPASRIDELLPHRWRPATLD